MKKAIILGIGACVGIALGYLGHGAVAVGFLRVREAYLFSGAIQSIGESLAFCTNRSLDEQKTSLLNYEAFLEKGMGHPDDAPVAFYYALAEARLSTVESGLNNRAEAMRHMQKAQEQLSKLGWTDVTPEHILAVVAHVYRQPEPSPSGHLSACSEQPSLPGINPRAAAERH